jgi:hypothetical protein
MLDKGISLVATSVISSGINSCFIFQVVSSIAGNDRVNGVRIDQRKNVVLDVGQIFLEW